MINYKKMKSQIHRGGYGYVWEVTTQQVHDSDWEIWSKTAPSKRKLIKLLVRIIHDKSMTHWRKEFLL